MYYCDIKYQELVQMGLISSDSFKNVGYFSRDFREGSSLNLLNNRIKEAIDKKNLKELIWKNNYKNALDLYPTVRMYDDIFIDILIENNIPRIIKELTNIDLILCNIHLRVATSGSKYLSWHRDRYFFGSPGYKIFYYPQLSNNKDHVLSIVKGTKKNVPHIKKNIFKQKINTALNSLHRIRNKVIKINSDNCKYHFVDTSILHAPAPVKEGNNSVRLIYFFCQKHQLERFPEDYDIDTMKIYKEKLKLNTF